MTQSLRLHAGVPLGAFAKLRFGVGLDFVSFDEEDETAADFVVPEDHTELSASLRLAYDREGWSFSLRGETAARSEWEPWGSTGELIDGEELESAEAFSRYEVVAQKTWFLKTFQQIEFDVTYRDGSDLDRFSAYTFGLLSGNRFRGFGGSGIRYDEGVLLDLSYAFNVKDLIRFEGAIDYGTVRGIEDGISTQHTGFGIAASFPGPWKTFFRIDAGVALDSDIEEIEGDTELLLLVLRLF